jgi:hypothetical protein
MSPALRAHFLVTLLPCQVRTRLSPTRAQQQRADTDGRIGRVFLCCAWHSETCCIMWRKGYVLLWMCLLSLCFGPTPDTHSLAAAEGHLQVDGSVDAERNGFPQGRSRPWRGHVLQGARGGGHQTLGFAVGGRGGTPTPAVG